MKQLVAFALSGFFIYLLITLLKDESIQAYSTALQFAMLALYLLFYLALHSLIRRARR